MNVRALSWSVVALCTIAACKDNGIPVPGTDGGGGADLATVMDAATAVDLAAGADATFSCSVASTSTLAGVAIRFTGDCRYSLAQAAAGIRVPYELDVAADIPEIVARSPNGSSCAQPGASGLILFEMLSGNGQSYCLCDTGLCAQPGMQAFTLKQGSYPATFDWDGRNWSGPSDTSNPEGPPFPAGTYQLLVRTTGTASGTAFDVSATMGLILSP
jgi:hypothetical protein